MTQLKEHKRHSWVGIKNAGLLRSTMVILRQWKAQTTLQWVDVNKRLYLPRHQAATQQAKEGAQQDKSHTVMLTMPIKF
ncbi:uncharacterized protein BT62DRAFT_908873 [Guyanagaster necrorhizus]|uniref:Uncharacterized protein n=1 Tax=Guyanagaster necrorhizus TaxID=856835 RepID=A0A9P8ANV8_9AGAR|nr:uncharacterized protein BT62DRAFT_908873 [Guyanagaster necrorhizus MCA 3950]KAG7441247.1 hypothetical protein BT62DRAFT_908873 [Guyanagaster necrorhizus MCA 3950]